MKYLIFLIILFSSPLYAVDLVSSQYTCTHKDNDLFREVKIIYKDQGCEVTLNKRKVDGKKISSKTKGSSGYLGPPKI